MNQSDGEIGLPGRKLTTLLVCVYGISLAGARGAGATMTQTPSAQTPSAQTATTNAPTTRVIAADFKLVKGPASTTWRHCVGAGRVGEGLRADWQQQLQLCKNELGFEYLRCHGLLHDELGVYREDPDGTPHYNWQYIDQVYDFLLSIGVRPFVEIGFMPDALATIPTKLAGTNGMADDPDHAGKKRRVTVFWWRSNVTPPKSTAKWDALVTALVRHWTERYGANEVRKWYFEVWNEPNHPGFFSPNDESKRRDEYFDLYAHTAKAVKSVDAAYRVGGPASAGTAWVADLISYGVANKVPVDFVSYHTYGLAGGAGGLDEFGERLQYINGNMQAVARAANGQRAVIDKTARPGLPIHVTEWSASYSARDPVHDSYFEAPYILEQLKHTETLGSLSYWTFTDIFEEVGIPPRAFHGGFGLVNLQGIKKPAFFAYRYRNELGPEELANADDKSWVCRDGKGGVQTLLWDLTPPAMNGEANQVYFRKDHPTTALPPVHLALSSLRPGRYRLTISRVGYQKNDAYTAYQKMGAPEQLSLAQTKHLRELTGDKPETTREIRVGADGRFQSDISLRQDDVVLATLTPVSDTKKTP